MSKLASSQYCKHKSLFFFFFWLALLDDSYMFPFIHFCWQEKKKLVRWLIYRYQPSTHLSNNTKWILIQVCHSHPQVQSPRGVAFQIWLRFQMTLPQGSCSYYGQCFSFFFFHVSLNIMVLKTSVGLFVEPVEESGKL